jgi:hypothetical protein
MASISIEKYLHPEGLKDLHLQKKQLHLKGEQGLHFRENKHPSLREIGLHIQEYKGIHLTGRKGPQIQENTGLDLLGEKASVSGKKKHPSFAVKSLHLQGKPAPSSAGKCLHFRKKHPSLGENTSIFRENSSISKGIRPP